VVVDPAVVTASDPSHGSASTRGGRLSATGPTNGKSRG
jgi:hypothetical protein